MKYLEGYESPCWEAKYDTKDPYPPLSKLRYKHMYMYVLIDM